MKLERARGTRDFAAEDALLRQQVVGTLCSVFELYGYNPLETPVIEKFETLASKYAGGEEILKETFKLKDQGGREIGLRYDLTVPMCRFIATNPNLKMPFKRYQIGSVFRDGPLKIGRYREFMQCDIDVVGVRPMAADAEIVEMAQEAFERLQLSVVIKVNNRKLLNGIIDAAGIKADKAETVILTLDKLEKLGKQAVEKELAEKGASAAAIRKLVLMITVQGSNSEKMQKLEKEVNSNEGKEGVEELRQMLECLDNQTNVEFDPSLARGLAYYTGTVFEAFLNEPKKPQLKEIKSAVAAGGRYDKMIGNFVGGGREYPAVGISFGLDIIEDALLLSGREKKRTTTSVYVVPIKAVAEAQKIAAKLRQEGISTDIDMSNRDVKRNLEYAAAAGMPYVVFVGEKEVKEGKLKVRNMKSGEEKVVSLSEAAEELKNFK
ncbi:histidine--tRNA ligase [Candidatus Woesearchaeota archaeon]|nr:histidine--tRNA ligase [Candidatus Woesearchaeota archaeon]